jgi:hypothetical protein
MPLNTDLNVAPYFDDYDANNEYYRILFRPGVAVQARELTQTQSILQNQIENFGGWAFKNGDIVSGCSIIDIPALPFIRLGDKQSNGALFTASLLVNTQVVSATSNLTARVFVANSGSGSNYPNTNVVYVQIVNTGNNGAKEFTNNDVLNFYSIPSNGTPVATINTYANTTAGQNTVGNAHGISVSNGVVFINGAFVNVLNPTYGIVNTYGTYASNNVVGFQLNEQIINENQDSSLLDNSLGYPNQNAPGAWRLKLVPTLISFDPTINTNTAGFNPIAVYNYGGLISKSTSSSNLYSIVGNAIAQRVYEEAGNYVVNPFVVDTVTGTTGNSIVSNLASTQVLGRVSPGVGYAQGQRVELLQTSYITMRRGVDTHSYKQQQITFSYGGYFILNEVSGIFPFSSAQTVNLYDTPQKSVTNRTYASTSPAGNLIGTATVRNFSYASGVPGSNTATYYLHVYNFKMLSGFQINQVQSVVYASGTGGVADVLSTGTQASSTKDQLYTFGLPGLKSLRDSANNNNTQYVYRTNATSTLTSSGNAVVTISSSAPGGTDILPYGIGALSPADSATFTMVATANVDTNALSGTVGISTSTTTVTGSSTNFLTDFAVGDLIKVGSTIRTVNSVTNSTSLTVDAVWGSTVSGQTYYKSYLNGRVIPFAYSTTGTTTGYVNVTNSTSFTVATKINNLSGSLGVNIFYDIERTVTFPATKVINKNQFVRLNLANNAGGPNGPWCLGFSDIHKITAICGTSNGSYTTSGTDLTNLFTYDTGQKDTHYGLGYLYPDAGFNAANYPNLLVQLDYFTVNTSPGCGFFTVESYPIDDANTANTTAIQTKDIPLYIDESGAKVWLRDYVDFRTPVTSTANNVGTYSAIIANVNTAITYATINPSSTVTFNVPSGGLNSPSYGKNFQADYTVYLPRKDLVTVTPDNIIKVIEGQSLIGPQSPLFPDNSMSLAVINIPPYPSLSTDQVDSDQAVNALSKNLIRDTSTAISINFVTNRRYTMADVGKLDKRISSLEYYAQLSLLQQQATNLTVTDQNGLNRFKNGIFVDSFVDFTLSDVSNPEYNVAIDKKKGQARPKFVTERFKWEFNSSTSTNVQKTGRVITLPYTEETGFISQPYATKYRSSAHVASHWTGSVTMMPCVVDNVDQTNTASVNITVDNASPWQAFANSPFGSMWGAWQTSTNTVSSAVTQGTENTYNLELGYQGGQATSQQALNNVISQYTAQGFVIGGTSLTFTSIHGGIGSNASITQVS